MTLQEWGALGELVGGVAVIATLAYLAVQTRQARRQAWAQAPQWISDGYRSWIGAPRGDPELAGLLIQAHHGWSGLSQAEQLRVHCWWGEKIVHLDAVLTLHDQGLIDDARKRAWVDDSLMMLGTAGGAEWWADTKFLFTPQVRAALEQRLEKPDTLPPPWTVTLPFFQRGSIDQGARKPEA